MCYKDHGPRGFHAEHQALIRLWAQLNRASLDAIGLRSTRVSRLIEFHPWNEEATVIFLPHVIRANHEQEFRIHLTFNDGTEATVDFEAWLTGPIFEPLRDLPYFQKLSVDGGTGVWPNAADIAPETLYEAAQAAQSNRGMQPTSRH